MEMKYLYISIISVLLISCQPSGNLNGLSFPKPKGLIHSEKSADGLEYMFATSEFKNSISVKLVKNTETEINNLTKKYMNFDKPPLKRETIVRDDYEIAGKYRQVYISILSSEIDNFEICESFFGLHEYNIIVKYTGSIPGAEYFGEWIKTISKTQ